MIGAIHELALKRNKMAFISGPRQVGKTTLSKSFSDFYNETHYKNWDEPTFRRQWTRDPNAIAEEFDLASARKTHLLILDEIHKARGWKTRVKGLYDQWHTELRVIVTGSARLNVFRKGGDSLMGRYLHFRLHPFSLGEIESPKSVQKLSPDEWRQHIFTKNDSAAAATLEVLFKFSGFPEPYLARSTKVLNVWRRGRIEKLIREDLRDLSRIPELSQVEMLASLLPLRVGSPISIQNLREDLEVSHHTVNRWLNYLKELYYCFELKPWTQSIPRSLKKEGKFYLYDWTEVEDEGARFENLVASHLLKACHYWTDTGEGNFDLFYLRNKEKQEIDFLIVKNKKPWLAVESKMSETKIDTKAFAKFSSHLKCPVVQVVRKNDIYRKLDETLVASASHVLHRLP